jgi:hypothetical protein
VLRESETMVNRRRLHWRPRYMFARKSDGTLYVPSHSGHPAFMGWYLRRVKRVAGRLYKETGHVWCVQGSFDDTNKVWNHVGDKEGRIAPAVALKEYLSLVKRMLVNLA